MAFVGFATTRTELSDWKSYPCRGSTGRSHSHPSAVPPLNLDKPEAEEKAANWAETESKLLLVWAPLWLIFTSSALRLKGLGRNCRVFCCHLVLRRRYCGFSFPFFWVESGSIKCTFHISLFIQTFFFNKKDTSQITGEQVFFLLE